MTNAANMLTLTLTNLNAILVKGDRENKTVNYSTFSKRKDEDVDDFINDLKKVFAINRVMNNRQYIVIASYLKEIAVSYYNKLAGITN